MSTYFQYIYRNNYLIIIIINNNQTNDIITIINMHRFMIFYNNDINTNTYKFIFLEINFINIWFLFSIFVKTDMIWSRILLILRK